MNPLHELPRILDVSAQLLLDKGLTRQMNHDPETGAVDLLGAVMLACGAKDLPTLVHNASEVVPPANMATYDAVENLLDVHSPRGSIIEWNDDPTTTFAEALLLLRKVGDEISSASFWWLRETFRHAPPSIPDPQDTPSQSRTT